VSGPGAARFATGRVVAVYCAGVALLVLVAGGDGGPRAGGRAVGHLALAALLLLLARLDRRGAGATVVWLHRWLPMIALPWLYASAGELRHLVVGRDFDPWIARFDAALFPGQWYRIGARLPSAVLELAHAAYASYYLLLFVPALVVERRRPREVERYLLAVTATMVAHYALDFALPVAGPMAREGISGRGVLFVPAIEAAYRGFDRGGLAFPSTHVAAAVVAAAFAARRFGIGRPPVWALWLAAIAASTVVCGYHYPIDVPAGLATGAAGAWLGGAFRDEPAATPPQRDPPRRSAPAAP
jgi:membrane-associated phospholipid phosphatase